MCYNSATVISTVTVLIFFNNTDLIEFPLLTVSKKVEEERIKVVIMGSETFIEVILAILIPPLGVFLRYGCGVFTLSLFLIPSLSLVVPFSMFLCFFLYIYFCCLIELIYVIFCFWGQCRLSSG